MTVVLVTAALLPGAASLTAMVTLALALSTPLCRGCTRAEIVAPAPAGNVPRWQTIVPWPLLLRLPQGGDA